MKLTTLFFSHCWPAGWWCTKSFGDIAGTVAIEMQNNAYVHALDSGLFTLGAPHNGKKSPDHQIGGKNIDIYIFWKFNM